jgi:acyl-coenzyme A thioesterase PaaI-like protein
VVFRPLPDEKFYNPIGSTHGGYASTLLDTALGCAVHSALESGEGNPSVELR